MNTSSRFHVLLLASAITITSAALLVATSSRQPMAWDEGDMILRAEQISQTIESSGQGEHAPWRDALRQGPNWPFTTQHEGHPPLVGILIVAGSSIAPGWLDPLTQARFGPILLFSIAVGALFYRLQREYKLLVVSLLAVWMLLVMPRVFAHAHLTTLDAPLTACWILTWCAFAPACRDWRWIPAFGLALGLTFTAKFTGWLAPLPFLVWTALYRDLRGLRALAVGLPIAVAVFVLLNPPLWSEPLAGLGTFFDLNLHRGARPEYNISTQFFGHMYNLDHPLPWYNSLTWNLITVSPMPLLFGIMGVISSLRNWRSDRAAGLLLCQWGTLIVVRALPWAPPHDAERLILPSFAFFAALIGVGAGRALYRRTLLEDDKIVAQGWAKVALFFVISASTFDAIGYFPHGLSYYNRLIGGLRGATALGMEPTYYWDSLDRTALDWLNEHTADGEKAQFGAAPPRNLQLLKRWGLLDAIPSDPGTFRWYVIQRRPSAWQPWDRWLIANSKPAFERSYSSVPLLDVYSYEDYEKAREATKPEASEP